MYRDGNAQTNQVNYLNSGSNTNSIGNEPFYRSQFARQIADIPMDTSENEQTLPMDHEQSIQSVSYQQLPTDHMQMQYDQPLTFAQSERLPLQYNQPLPIAQAERIPLQYNQPLPISQAERLPLQYNQPLPIAQVERLPLQYNPPLPIAQSERKPITYDQPLPIEETKRLPLQYEATSQPSSSKVELYVCTLCETPTKFGNFQKLSRHVERFHKDFEQEERGTKRSCPSYDEVLPKKLRWESYRGNLRK
jgi:hypothetical protein